MGLREVLAELDVKVRGAGAVGAANAELDQYVASLSPAESAIEGLRVRQSEAAEMASRLASRVRELQAAEGDHTAEIEQTRRAQIRASASARSYGQQAADLEAQSAAAAQGQRTWAQGLAEWLTPARLATAALAALAAGALVAARTVAAAARAAAEMVAAVIEEGHELANLAARLNVSTTELQRWRFIAEQTGLESTALTSSFGALARNAESAAHGAGPAAADFRRLGVSLRDANGHLRDQGALFADTVRALAGVEDRTRRSAIAQRIFSEGGAQLLALIDQGPDAIDRLSSRFDELGGGLSEDVVAGAEEAHDSLAEFDVLVDSLRSQLVRHVLPVLNRFLHWATDYSAGIGRAVERSSALWLGWGALRVAGTGVEVMLTALGRTLYALVRPLVVGFLLFEDLVTAFRGGRSVIGDWVERFFAARGVTITFQGVLDRLGMSWTHLDARASRAIASILEGVTVLAAATGATDLAASLTPTAMAWRDRAAAGETAVADADRVAAAVDAGRLFSRKVAADPTIATRARDAAAAAASITTSTTYNITASDPEGVRREIEAHERRRAREAADALPLAAGAV